jgi:hypothetical protein
MRKLTAFIAALMLSSGIITTANTEAVRLKVDGKEVHFRYGTPFIEEGTSLLPLRDLLLSLGVQDDPQHIIWNGEEQEVAVLHGNTIIHLRVGQTDLIRNYELFRNLEVPAKNIEGRIYLPARAVAEALGARVEFDGETNTIVIQTAAQETPANNEAKVQQTVPESAQNTQATASAQPAVRAAEENPLFPAYFVSPDDPWYPKMGFIDRNGQTVISPKYLKVRNFSEGYAVVELDYYKHTYIDKSGKQMTSRLFETAEDFSDGMARVSVDGKYGYIDTTGKMVIEPQFASADSFSDGLALVSVGGKRGYIDKSGKMVIEVPDEIYFAGRFHDGMATWIKTGRRGEQYGYIDTSGKLAIPFRRLTSRDFSDGYALTNNYDYAFDMSKEILYRFINKSGNFVFTPFTRAYSFSEGLAAVEIDGKFGFIDTSGRVVIEPKFEDLPDMYFSDGLAKVKLEGKYGYIDRTGAIVIEPKAEYEFASAFKNGLAQLTLNGNYMYFDKTGKVVYSVRLP